MAEAPGFGGVGGQGRAPQSLCQLRLTCSQAQTGDSLHVSALPVGLGTTHSARSLQQWFLLVETRHHVGVQDTFPRPGTPPSPSHQPRPRGTAQHTLKPAAPGLASSLLPAAPWPRLLAQEAAKCPFPARSQPHSTRAGPAPPPGMALCPPARAAAFTIDPLSCPLSSLLPAEPGHHCQGWGSDRGGGAPGTPSSKAVRGGGEGGTRTSFCQEKVGCEGRGPCLPQSPVAVPAQPEGPQPEEEEESWPALGLAHPQGWRREGPGPACPRASGRLQSPRPLGACQRPAQRLQWCRHLLPPAAAKQEPGAPALPYSWPQRPPLPAPGPPTGWGQDAPPTVCRPGGQLAGQLRSRLCRAQQSRAANPETLLSLRVGQADQLLIPKTEVSGVLQVSPCTPVSPHPPLMLPAPERAGGNSGPPQPWAGRRSLGESQGLSTDLLVQPQLLTPRGRGARCPRSV